MRPILAFVDDVDRALLFNHGSEETGVPEAKKVFEPLLERYA